MVHIGLMKTGTSFIQGRLAANTDLLAEQGLLFPGGARWATQVRGISDLIGGKHHGSGAWAELSAQVDGHDGTAIISMEYLAAVGRPAIERLRDRFPSSEVRAVMTVRDLGRAVPSQWQESVKNRATRSWEEYVEGIRRHDEAGRPFWRQQGADRIAARWAEVLGAADVHVVTVPPPGSPSHLLWDRFAEVAGIGPAAWHRSTRSNPSLGAASTEVLRLLNLATPDQPQAKSRVKRLARRIIAAQAEPEDMIGFEPPAWLHDEADRIVAALTEGGYPVAGDLAELRPVAVPGVDPGSQSDAVRLDAAVRALGALLFAEAAGDTDDD